MMNKLEQERNENTWKALENENRAKSFDRPTVYRGELDWFSPKNMKEILSRGTQTLKSKAEDGTFKREADMVLKQFVAHIPHGPWVQLVFDETGDFVGAQKCSDSWMMRDYNLCRDDMKFLLNEESNLTTRNDCEEPDDQLRTRFKHRVPFSPKLVDMLENRKAAAISALASSPKSTSKRKGTGNVGGTATSKKQKARSPTVSAAELKSAFDGLHPADVQPILTYMKCVTERTKRTLLLEKTVDSQKHTIEKQNNEIAGLKQHATDLRNQITNLTSSAASGSDVSSLEKEIVSLKKLIRLREEEIILLKEEA